MTSCTGFAPSEENAEVLGLLHFPPQLDVWIQTGPVRAHILLKFGPVRAGAGAGWGCCTLLPQLSKWMHSGSVRGQDCGFCSWDGSVSEREGVCSHMCEHTDDAATGHAGVSA